MPLNSVQQYVRALLDGQQSPQQAPAQAFISPPLPGDADVPQIYVWGGRLQEQRETMPRGGGYKKLHWQVSIWVYMPDVADDAEIDTAFPCLIDAIMDTLRAVPLPVALSDPVTAQVSSILFVGEQLQVQYGTPRATADQRYIWQNALITADVDELLQA